MENCLVLDTECAQLDQGVGGGACEKETHHPVTMERQLRIALDFPCSIARGNMAIFLRLHVQSQTD